MPKLYEISQEFHALLELSNSDEVNEETGEVTNNDEVLKELFEGVKLELGVKLENTAFVIANIEYEMSSSQGEIAHLQKIIDGKKKSILAKENNIIRLKELMKIAISASGEDKLETDKWKFAKSTKKDNAVDIASEDNIPRKYLKPTYKPMKKEIKEALKSGLKVDGCSLRDTVSFSIKMK